MSALFAWCRRRWSAWRGAERRDERHQLGQRGEDLAVSHLASIGLRCIDRNVRLRGGEIDLICEARDGAIVFVEVKTRTGDEYAGELAINRAKRARLIRLVQVIARRRRWLTRRLRIDVVVIVWPEGDEPVVRHHPSAVTLDG